jgi:hypothetical protein
MWIEFKQIMFSLPNLKKSFYSLIIINIFIFLVNISYFLQLFNHVKFVRSGRSNENFLLNTKIDKWIVVTTINQPTKQIKSLSKINGFQLLIVGDLKTDPTWSFNQTIYLGVNNQKSFSLKSIETTPFNSYNRKNIGYLYAIKNGAKFIYDTDDDNEPLVDLNKYFNYDEYTYGLTYDCNATKSVLNPYAHFGQPLIWPRGFPLDKIDENYYNSYFSGQIKTSYIQQGVVNGDPDVDAIFRLTKSMKYKRINLYFDDRSPPIQIPAYKLTPYNSQNTLFHYKSFWSLYLPKTVSFRLTDIWRSYWSQRLMWLLNGTVSFNGPSAFQYRNSHSYLKDFEEEQSMYLQTSKLIDFLLEWKCNKLKFYQCLMDLSIEMSVKDFWKKEEIVSIQNWIDDLNSIGYKEPEIVNFEINTSKNDSFLINCKLNDQKIPVRYTPKFQKSIDLDNLCCNQTTNLIDMNQKIDSYLFFKNFCSNNHFQMNHSLNHILNSDKYFKKYDLIVTFNRNIRPENVVFIKHLYGNTFQNIIFCGKGSFDILNENRAQFKMFDSYTFIELDIVKGYFGYDCMTKVIEMNYNTNGFLIIGDDVLMKYWNFDKYDFEKIWWYNYNGANMTMRPKSYWWYTNMGESAIKNFLNFSENEIKNRNLYTKSEYEILQEFLSRRLENKTIGLYKKFDKVWSDYYYLPKSKFKKFQFIAKLVRKFNIFLEFAVDFILNGIEDKSQLVWLSGYYVWSGYDGQNTVDLKNFDKYGDFMHPFKISKIFNTSTNIGFEFCQFYINKKYDIAY